MEEAKMIEKIEACKSLSDVEKFLHTCTRFSRSDSKAFIAGAVRCIKSERDTVQALREFRASL